MLIDVNSMSGNGRTVSYINLDDDETLDNVKNIYNIIKQES